MKIREIFIEQNHLKHYDDEFKGIHFDTRQISAGQIFVAIKTEKNDGHNYVEDAIINKEIAGAIIDKNYLERFDRSLYKYLVPVNNVENYLIEKGKFFLDKLNLKYKIAITGTVGKTTTKELCASMLNKKFRVYKSFKNFNNFLGLIYNIFNIPEGTEIVVFEIGTNYPGEIDFLASIINPHIGIITKIGHGHLEFFKDLENVAKEKADIFRYLQRDKIAIFNKEDSILQKYIKAFDIKKKVIIEYGKDYLLNGNILQYANRSFEINSYILPYIDNLALVLALADYFDINNKLIQQSIDEFKPSDKRMEIIELNNILIINDCYNSNPDSMELFIRTATHLSNEKKKELVFVLGDMFELGELAVDLHKKIGNLLLNYNENIMKIFALGDYSRYFIEGNSKGEFFNNDRNALFDRLKACLGDDIIIGVKGSRGMRMEEITERILGYVKGA